MFSFSSTSVRIATLFMPSRRPPPLQTLNRYRRFLLVLTGSVVVLAWRTVFYAAPIAAIEYQPDIHGKQYYGCIFGDSISAGVGNTLGHNTYNFAVGGLSSTSLVEQLKNLSSNECEMPNSNYCYWHKRCCLWDE